MFFNQLLLIIFNFIFLTHRRHGFVEARLLLTSNATLSNTQERDLNPYSLPQNAQNAQIRAAAITATQAGFSYGPPVAGGPFFPAGDIGKAKIAADMALETQEAVPVVTMITGDGAQAMNDTSKYDGLTTVEDYIKLYDGEWTQTLPTGLAPGVSTNYTQDLMFSMERLSTSPFAIRRLNPSSDSLAFEVDTSIVRNMSGMTLQQLLEGGRLFYIDHSYQAKMNRTERFAAACDAYFLIDNTTGNFLPLAIRTGVGANLIYTPLDEQADWQLAKIMFNVNDFVFTQMHHLGAMHEVLHIVWMAAIRTLSVDHPVYALLNRIMYQAFAIQPLADSLLFSNGGVFDRLFPFTGEATRDLATSFHNNKTGAFQANYFRTDLQSRGLVGSSIGPELSHFPFFEDASTINDAIQAFMESFVESYYTTDAEIEADNELQAWVREAAGPAKVVDFPPAPISGTETIVDILTQMAHLSSAAHHAVNTNELISISGTLPMHPASLYQSPPTTKGNTSIVEFLPPLLKCVDQFSTHALFSRRLLANTNRTILHMFDDPNFLAMTNNKTQAAAAKFKDAMTSFSEQIASRAFDSNGLSQGTPFLWKALDPKVAPYSAST